MPTPADDKPRYERVKAILSDALDQPIEVRREWIANKTHHDASLRVEVEALLDEIDQLDGFLEKGPSLPEDASELGQRTPPSILPETIGGMRVLRLLGFGSMGVVYLAEQDHPRRRVAVKVLRSNTVGDDVVQRFEREIEALGRLQHSGIAQIYEAGLAQSHEGDQRWFSMEYIDGSLLREHCRRERLSNRARVQLMVLVLDVVQYAHDRGVMHRDLKPDNILVTRDGLPKLLDFGVARLRQEEDVAVLFTITGAIVGTIAYMSPEQARGAAVAETTDVFSLGAILYELLTERLPFESRGRSLHQLIRSLAEDEPTPISTHDPALHGDIAAIVHMAIESDYRRRYPSVREFADDLRRWLGNRPVHARPPTALDQVRKTIRRNRRLAALVTLGFATLSIALVVSLAGLKRATTAEKQAQEGHDDVMRLSHNMRFDELETRADELWPVGPGIAAGLRQWLEEARELLFWRGKHEAYLADLEELARTGELERSISGEGSQQGAQWVLAKQRELVQRTAEFASTEPPGLVALVHERLRLSEELTARTIGDHAAAWATAVESIASNPSYHGLIIEPQIGLVPLGPDPDSGLWEFALHSSIGRVPSRNTSTGVLELTDDITIVFVLLPGGQFQVGSQITESDEAFFDPNSEAHESPLNSAQLDPYFISKFEVTQSQWTTFEGSNPSYWSAGKSTSLLTITLRHPVEYMNRDQAIDFARKLGCLLPTEAQWEVAARGGTTTTFIWGRSPGSQTRRLVTNTSGWVPHDDSIPERRDEFDLHAPIGSLAANPFGLHDMIGNVAEFCIDDYKINYPALDLRDGDGRVLIYGGGEYSIRGSSFITAPKPARFAARHDVKSLFVTASNGIRLVRVLSPARVFPPDQAPPAIPR